MTRRIVVTGSECTGKTTLAARLAERLGCPWVPEFARAWAEQVQRPLTVADVEPIAHGQLAAESRAMAHALTLVQDTDLVSTVVYANAYYDSCPAWVADAARTRLAHDYLLCDIDLPWVADGIRDAPAQRARMHQAFADELARLGARVHLVHGIGESRLASALAALRADAGP